MATAATSLLQQVRCFKKGYTFYGEEELRQASIDLVRALHAGNQLDLSAPVHDDPAASDLPLPAAWSLEQNVFADRLSVWVELDPGCLAVMTARGPSFKIAVEAALSRVGEGMGEQSRGCREEDESLAAWARHIPTEHCLAFDQPGDDPGAGLLMRLRQSGHYPMLEDELARKGLDLDGCLADGTPTSTFIHAQPQWDAWLSNGGDPRRQVPASDGRPAMPVWDYQALLRPGKLLPSVQAWMDSAAATEAMVKRLDHLTFWHRIDTSAQTSTRDEFLSTLKEFPGWVKRTDDQGRCVLFRVLQKQPAFLNSCMSRASWRKQLHHHDAKGRGVWYYAIPALRGHNRLADAQAMAKKLSTMVSPSLDQVSGDRQCGLLLLAALRDHNDPLPPRPDAKDYDQNQKWRAAISARTPGYGKLFPLGLEALLGGTPEEQKTVAAHLMAQVVPGKFLLSRQDTVASHVARELALQAVAPGWVGRAIDDSHVLDPDLRAALAYVLLCPQEQDSLGSSVTVPKNPEAVSAIMPLLRFWAHEGMVLPGKDAWAHYEVLDQAWRRGSVFSFSGSNNPPRQPDVIEMLDVWKRFEETARMDRETALVSPQSASGRMRL